MITKFFIGTRFSPELRHQLYGTESSVLRTIPYEGKEYVGFYLETHHPSLQEIQEARTHFIQALQAQCPEVHIDLCHQVIFAQLFLG